MTRIVGTFRLVLAGLVTMAFAVMAIVTLPFNRGGNLFHTLAQSWSRSLLVVFGVRVVTRGLEKIDFKRNYVYVSNHASLLDIPAITAGIPDQIRIIYKKELERIPLFGHALRWGGYIAIDRSRGAEAMKSLEEAAESIRRGKSVLLYAEGTRTADGKLQPFKRGAFTLAVRAGVPVVPLTINGSYNIIPKHSLALRPGTVELVLDHPITLDGTTGRDAEVRLMDQVHTVIERHYVDQ